MFRSNKVYSCQNSSTENRYFISQMSGRDNPTMLPPNMCGKPPCQFTRLALPGNKNLAIPIIDFFVKWCTIELLVPGKSGE